MHQQDEQRTEVELSESGKLPKDMSARLRAARTDRQPHIAIWDAGLSFLHGDQKLRNNVYSAYSVQSRDKRGRDKGLAVSNRMLPIYRSSVAAFAAQFPKVTVSAMNPSYDDEIKKVTNKYALRAWWTMNKMPGQMRKAAEWMSPCGSVGWLTYWDPGREKVCTEVIRPYDILFEAENASVEMADWGAARRIVTRSEAINAYPDNREFLLKVPAVSQTEQDDAIRSYTDRVELWHTYFKDGRCGVWCHDRWLFESRTPEDIFPISLSRWTPFPDWLYGMPQLFPLIDPQIQYNLFRSFMLDTARLMSNPMWLIPNQAGVRASQLTNDPGQPVMYNGMSAPPTRVSAPQIPPHIFDIQSRQLGEMEDLGGMHSTTMGKRSPGLSAAVSMQTLAQGDINQLFVTQQELEDAIAHQASCALVYWKHYMPEKKIVAIFDEAYGTVVSRGVKSANIVDLPEVTIETGTSFVSTTEERDARLIELAQLGVVDPETVKNNLSFTIDERSELDRINSLAHARDLLEALENGHNVELSEYDEAPLYIAIQQVFGEYVRSPRFYEGAAEAQQAQKQAMQMGEENLDASNRIMVQNNIWSLYKEAGMLLQQLQQPQMQGPPGQMGGGLRNPGRGQPSGAGQGGGGRPGLNDSTNLTARTDSLKGRPGTTGAP